MRQGLTLLIPALIPSWRFFDWIAPSPRIEFAFLRTPQESAEQWHSFRPRPARLTIGQMLTRLFWNPQWNESLFLMSCAERLVQNPTPHSVETILHCIRSDLRRDAVDMSMTPYLQFRLVFISRQGKELQQHIAFVSPVMACAPKAEA
jgi:hypothetical protein